MGHVGLSLGFCNDFGLNLPGDGGFKKSVDIGDLAKEKPLLGLDAEKWARNKNKNPKARGKTRCFWLPNFTPRGKPAHLFKACFQLSVNLSC